MKSIAPLAPLVPAVCVAMTILYNSSITAWQKESAGECATFLVAEWPQILVHADGTYDGRG
jgi:hypothetical protein